MAGRILVIRGGALGDFILTLPALGLLREAFPSAHLELLGYRHIVELAVGRYYADASRSIEYGPLAGFFNPASELDPELATYFSEFHQIISYLFDPDELFANNLRRAGVRNLIVGNPKINDRAHASIQLAAPLQQLALYLEKSDTYLYPTEADKHEATSWLGNFHPTVAIHPGSGGEHKNWPLKYWIEFANQLIFQNHSLLIIGGESDTIRMAELRAQLPQNSIRFAEHLPLTTLAAILAHCRLFVGHDSGISHLAAATGIPCVLLFGPTDPVIWAPTNPGVRIIASPSSDRNNITLDSVRKMTDSVLINV